MKKYIVVMIILQFILWWCSKKEVTSEVNKDWPIKILDFDVSKSSEIGISLSWSVSINNNEKELLSTKEFNLDDYLPKWTYSVVQKIVKWDYTIITVDPITSTWTSNKDVHIPYWTSCNKDYSSNCINFILKNNTIIYTNLKEKGQFINNTEFMDDNWSVYKIYDKGVVFVNSWAWTSAICNEGDNCNVWITWNFIYINFETLKKTYQDYYEGRTCTIGKNSECKKWSEKTVITKKYYILDSDWKEIEIGKNAKNIEEAYFSYYNDKNLINFTDLQIKEILVKIDDNIKKQQEIEKNSTWILIQWNYKAVYIAPKDYAKDMDKIVVTIAWKKYELPGVYGKDIMKKYLELIKEWHCKTSGDLSDVIVNWKYYVNPSSWDCWMIGMDFWNFVGFSPTWYYVLYTSYGYEWTKSILVDVETWKNIIETNSRISTFIWTPDKKQLIYWTIAGMSDTWPHLYITKKWRFPEKILIQNSEEVRWLYVDENYFYTKEYSEYKDKNYFKVYSLKTLKEVFSKEIN